MILSRVQFARRSVSMEVSRVVSTLLNVIPAYLSSCFPFYLDLEDYDEPGRG